MGSVQRDGYAIALAWPEHRGKQAGSWYDPIMQIVGINRNYHYKVGHAALILVDSGGQCHYFDCGRFHAPYQKGRIRGSGTDNELLIKTRAITDHGQISNINNILEETQLNPANIGEGKLLASACPVNYDLCLKSVKCIQGKGYFPFGPFVIPGTNCCRFVKNSIIEGNPPRSIWWKLKFLFPVWPKPITIISLMGDRHSIPSRQSLAKEYGVDFVEVHEIHEKIYNPSNIHGNLPSPKRPECVPTSSQWLSGEVLGSWYHIDYNQSDFVITRYAEDGHVECQGVFQPENGLAVNLNEPFQFTHLSHCAAVTIEQGGRQVRMIRTGEVPIA